MEPLAEGTLVEAIMDTRAQIDFLWQFFVTLHIAIFALLFIYDEVVESLNIIARVLAVAGVALFDYINGRALQNTYHLLDAMLEQYRMFFGQDQDRFHPAFLREFVQASFEGRADMIYITHGMALFVVLLAMVSRSFIQRRARHGAGRA